MRFKSIREADIEAIISRMRGNTVTVLTRREAKKFKLILKKAKIPFSVTYTKHGIKFEIH